jgi:hypothetical protein
VILVKKLTVSKIYAGKSLGVGGDENFWIRIR